jgi:hypothetical protein
MYGYMIFAISNVINYGIFEFLERQRFSTMPLSRVWSKTIEVTEQAIIDLQSELNSP